MIKSQKAILNATPSKRLYRSIIADYGLDTAIAELIDNVIDSRKRRKFTRTIEIKVNIDLEDQTITLEDDAGGIREADLEKLVSPGDSLSDGTAATIGIFGVGSKRAAVALARDIKFSTRFASEPNSFLVEYDDDWLAQEDWNLPYYQIDPLKKNTTKILLSRLRFHLTETDQNNLVSHLAQVYANFIKDKEIKIFINGFEISPVFFDQWAFPPKASPTSFEKRFIPDGQNLPIIFRITSGLTYQPGSIGRNFGVYVYCNRRLIAKSSKEAEFGFQSGVAGVVHPRMSNARIIVELEGGASRLPWNSSKTGINFNHEVFRAIRADIHTAVKNATALSKRLQPSFDISIAPFQTGSVAKKTLKANEALKPSKLPTIPVGQKSPQNAIKEANRETAREMPWAIGAYEGIIAVEAIKKQGALSQKNRLNLIILDSTLEIAFKDYLSHNLPQSISEDRLRNLFKNRTDVHNEVKQTIATGNSNLWQKVSYFYKMRCELVHKRASVQIPDDELAEFQEITESLLSEMFGLDFPKT